jgi:HAD superfamily hydrolase (TIGR01490 family)
MIRLTLFDLDHTLLDGDSDVLWCEFLMDRGLLDRALFEPRNRAIEAAYKAGTVGVLEFCGFYVGTLAGRTPAEWEPLRRSFRDEVLVPRIGAAARALVGQAQADAALVVLTTATNRFIGEPAAEHLGITHLIATECEVGVDGRFSGRVAGLPNMREGKVVRLRAWLADRGLRADGFETWVYSDSMNDLPLLEAADRAVVVHADERLARIAAERNWHALQLHAGKR